jgi:hypothetical protein
MPFSPKSFHLNGFRPYSPDAFYSFGLNTGVGLALSVILLGMSVLPASAVDWGKMTGTSSKKSSGSAVKKEFLPPVASINGPLHSADEDEEGLGPVTFNAVHSPNAIQVHQPVAKLDTDLGIKTSSDEYQELLKSQKALDEEDLRALWSATVEKNPVIRFSLEKLSTPADLGAKKSSQFLNKTLNVLISGATIAATMAPGGGYYRNMGAMAGGDAVRNILNGNSKPQLQTLSPTEQIQLAGLVDELQAKLVQTYHDYKNTLQSLATAHDQSVSSNKIYHDALQSGNDLAILASASAYYKAVLNETELKQKAKLNRLRLERLAGDEALQKLKLSVTVTKDITASTMAQPVNLAQPDNIEPPVDTEEGTPEPEEMTGIYQKNKKQEATAMPAVALPPEPDKISP